MGYYRISFNRVTTPDPFRPLDRRWEWFDLICKAQNREEAESHGRQVAREKGVDYCCTMRLPAVKGAVLIQRKPAFQAIPERKP